MWHLHALAEICAADPALLLATAYREAALDDERQCEDASRLRAKRSERLVRTGRFTLHGCHPGMASRALVAANP
jgi:hypothetical protein